jgi:hypothetical protein
LENSSEYLKLDFGLAMKKEGLSVGDKVGSDVGNEEVGYLVGSADVGKNEGVTVGDDVVGLFEGNNVGVVLGEDVVGPNVGE